MLPYLGSLCLLFATIATTELATIRTLYTQAASSETKNNQLIAITQKNSNAVYQAYYGAAVCIKAKHHWNPYQKLKFVEQGLDIINNAANESKSEVEIRYVRFSIESNLPSFVSFTSHTTEDKKFLLENLSQKHAAYKQIKDFLLSSNSLTQKEKNQIR